MKTNLLRFLDHAKGEPRSNFRVDPKKRHPRALRSPLGVAAALATLSAADIAQAHTQSVGIVMRPASEACLTDAPCFEVEIFYGSYHASLGPYGADTPSDPSDDDPALLPGQVTIQGAALGALRLTDPDNPETVFVGTGGSLTPAAAFTSQHSFVATLPNTWANDVEAEPQFNYVNTPEHVALLESVFTLGGNYFFSDEGDIPCA
jgi:hypothetical protein